MSKQTPKTVLIVDDEEIILQSLQRILGRENFVLEMALDAESAMEKLENPVSLLICDVRLPDMDGLALVKRAKEKHSNLKTILLTGFTDESIAETGKQLGVDMLIMKPIQDISNFVSTVHRFVE